MISNAEPPARALTVQSRGSGIGGAWDKFTAPTERYRRPFRTWRRGRPFIPGLCILLAGLEIYWAPHSTVGQLLSMGLPGISSLFIPIFLIVFAVTVWFFPTYRVFSGIAAILLALLSLVATDLGGFFVGFLLAMLGGAFAVAWTPRTGYTADTRRQRRRQQQAEAVGVGEPAESVAAETEGSVAEESGVEPTENTRIIEKAAHSDEAAPAAETTTEEE